MPDIKYTGTADVRKIRERDFTDNEITDQGEVVFSKDNKFKATVSEAAATFLVDNDPKSFTRVDGAATSEPAQADVAPEEPTEPTVAPAPQSGAEDATQFGPDGNPA